MAKKEEQITKKDIKQLLTQQTKVILDSVEERIDKKIDEKIDGLAVMVKNGFQGTQDYMDKKFNIVDKKFDQVTEKVNNISRNIVDVVRKEEFKKLESRVEKLEEAV